MLISSYANIAINCLSTSFKEEANHLIKGTNLYFKYILPYSFAILMLKGMGDEIINLQFGLPGTIIAKTLSGATYCVGLGAILHIVNKEDSFYKIQNAKEIKIPVQDLQDMMKHLEFLKK